MLFNSPSTHTHPTGPLRTGSTRMRGVVTPGGGVQTAVCPVRIVKNKCKKEEQITVDVFSKLKCKRKNGSNLKLNICVKHLFKIFFG